MASLVRPTKRQKQDHVNRGVFTELTVPNADSCIDSTTSLFPLVERFTETHFTCSDALIDIIGKIRAHSCFIGSKDLRDNTTSNLNDHDNLLSIRKLHGSLILHLGFVLGSQKQMLITGGKWKDLLIALVFCLRDLYTSGMLSKFIVEEEFNELFILVPKIVLSISSDKCIKAGAFQISQIQEMKISCYRIIKSWLGVSTILTRVLAKSTTTTLENFLFCLMRSRDTSIIEGSNKHDSSLEVLEQLRSLCHDNAEFRKLLDVAIFAMKSHPSSSFGHQSPRLNILYWRCISCVSFERETNTGKNTEIALADNAIDSMMPYCTSNNRTISRQAVACIGEYIQNASDDRRIRFTQFATESILENSSRCDARAIENVKDENLIQTLDCFGLCMERASTIDFFLRMKGWEKIFDVLVLLAEDEKDASVAEKATVVLVAILKVLTTSTEIHPPTHFQKSIHILLKLLSSHYASISAKTVELLFTVLQNSETQRRIASSTLIPDLVSTLALLSSKNFLVEESKKAKLAQTFSILIDDIRNVHFLARKSSNLAFLVRLANGSYCDTEQRRVQQISICTLMKLARNPCNQRILAKEPGLLSCLIRYTRMTPEDAEVFNERSVSRKEMKERILLMANAL